MEKKQQEKDTWSFVLSKRDRVVLICVVLATGIIGYFSISIGSRTIISYWYLIKTSLILGFITLLIFGFFKLIYWEDLGIVFWKYVLASFISGTLFIFSNSFSTNSVYKDVTFKLKGKRVWQNKTGKDHPIAAITYNGSSKDIWFGRFETAQFQLADSILIKVRKGNLGYGIMKGNYQFISNEE